MLSCRFSVNKIHRCLSNLENTDVPLKETDVWRFGVNHSVADISLDNCKKRSEGALSF